VTDVDVNGMVHGFFWQVGAMPSGRWILADIAAFLRQHEC